MKEGKITIHFTDGVPGEVTFEGADDLSLVAAMASNRTLRKAMTEALGLLLNLEEVDPVDLLNDVSLAATQYKVKKEGARRAKA